MLMPEERALLFRACCDHPVAKCRRCRCSFRMTELAADLFQGLSHLCPRCRIDLTDAAGEHLLSCAAATTPPLSTRVPTRGSFARPPPISARKRDSSAMPQVWPE